MKKKWTYTLLYMILSVPISLMAQRDTPTLQAMADKQSSYISLNALTFLNTYNQRWRVGYIQQLKPRWKVGLDVGYGNRALCFGIYKDNVGKGYQLWEIRPELYYSLGSKGRYEQYLSLELFYIHHKEQISLESYQAKDGTSIRFDTANYFRQKYGYHLKYGLFRQSKKRLTINMYTGIGLRIRNNQYSEVLNPRDNVYEATCGWLFTENYKKVEGSALGVNVSLGLKLCYKLKQGKTRQRF
ncbi:MAG: hypothetical protein QGH06_02765 [Lutibacter sp.]|nr:hypothetical protein [Lutibacter sp.]